MKSPLSTDVHDLDQKLFGWIWGLWKRARATPKRASAIDFATVEPRLSMLASIIAGRRMRVQPTADRGGALDDTLRLPATIDVFATAEENAMLYVLRTALDASLAQMGMYANKDADPELTEFASALLVPSLMRMLADDFPGLLRIADALTPAMQARIDMLEPKSARHVAWRAVFGFALAPDATASSPLTEVDCALLRTRTPDDAVGHAFRIATRLARLHTKGDPFTEIGLPLIGPFPRLIARMPIDVASPPEASPGGTERMAPARDLVRVVPLSENAEDDNPLVHSFEKVHTAEAYKGGQKSVDGEDELEAHQSALEEVTMNQVVRTRAKTRSTYRMDVIAPFGSVPEDETPSPETSIAVYDEWGGKAYRAGYCRVFVERPAEPVVGSLEPRVSPDKVRRIRRVFEAIDDARRIRLREPSGGEVDIDAVVARHAFVRAGKEGGDRLYAARRPVEHDIATLLLLDVSSSSDGWLDGRHVIDLEREAAACIGDALDEMKSPFSIAGFYSHTHRDCRFVEVKSFKDRWHACRARVSMLDPKGYTRIGPAIRHATSLLGRVPARRRALLVVTDGRPTDYDHYEGRYGIDDVRMAWHEAQRVGITPFALCVTGARTAHLAEMFGPSGYEVVRAPDDLPGKLAAAQRRFRCPTGHV